MYSNSVNAAQIAEEMQATFGQALIPYDAAMLSQFFIKKLNDNALVINGPTPTHQQPPPPLVPGQASSGQAPSSSDQANAKPIATAQTQVINSDEEIPDASDDQVSTDEELGDDELEARKRNLKEGDKLTLKRTTRRKNKLATAKQAKKTHTTTTVLKS